MINLRVLCTLENQTIICQKKIIRFIWVLEPFVYFPLTCDVSVPSRSKIIPGFIIAELLSFLFPLRNSIVNAYRVRRREFKFVF
jgi:hypothetical protein